MTRLEKILHQRAANKSELARRCDVTKQTMHNWINGKTRIPGIAALTIAEILNCDPREVIGTVEESSKKQEVAA